MSALPDFAAARVLVAGDVMLDRYWSGSTSRISPEAPVPVVRVRGDESRPGGAANVALNLAALGVQASVLGVVGADEAARTLANSLRERGVEAELMPGSAPTITKLRVMSRNQQLLRLDFEEALAPAHDAVAFAARLRVNWFLSCNRWIKVPTSLVSSAPDDLERGAVLAGF